MQHCPQVLKGSHWDKEGHIGGEEGETCDQYGGPVVLFPPQRKGEEVLKGAKRNHLDFLDILLEAKV